MRLFVGIPLVSSVIDALERLTASLRADGDGLRWSSPETWHITLQFLGEVQVEKYGYLVDGLAGIQSPYVPIWLSGTGIFDRSGVFWAGVSVSSELRLLEKQLVAATSQCGYTGEERPFRPHVTLARAKGGNRVQVLRNLRRHAKEELEFPRFTATEFLLYESFPGSDGAKHVVREHFPLELN